MRTFVAVFHGPTFNKAKVISITTNQNVVSSVVEQILTINEDESMGKEEDPILHLINCARRDALSLILQGEKGAEL